jgi:NADPH:quinone reductase-like Zn-dependent oxidoreductase
LFLRIPSQKTVIGWGRWYNSVTRPILFHYIGQRKDLERMAANVFNAVDQGVLAVDPGKVFPLTEAAMHVLYQPA